VYLAEKVLAIEKPVVTVTRLDVKTNGDASPNTGMSSHVKADTLIISHAAKMGRL